MTKHDSNIAARRRWKATGMVLGLVLVGVTLSGCGGAAGTAAKAARTLGRDEGAIANALKAAASKAGHSEDTLTSALDRAGSIIEERMSPVLSSGVKTESARESEMRSAVVDVACRAIAMRVRSPKGKDWPSASDLDETARDVLRSRTLPGYDVAQTAASAMSMAQSLWTDDPVREDVVRNVVCKVVNVSIP